MVDDNAGCPLTDKVAMGVPCHACGSPAGSATCYASTGAWLAEGRLVKAWTRERGWYAAFVAESMEKAEAWVQELVEGKCVEQPDTVVMSDVEEENDLPPLYLNSNTFRDAMKIFPNGIATLANGKFRIVENKPLPVAESKVVDYVLDEESDRIMNMTDEEIMAEATDDDKAHAAAMGNNLIRSYATIVRGEIENANASLKRAEAFVENLQTMLQKQHRNEIELRKQVLTLTQQLNEACEKLDALQEGN